MTKILCVEDNDDSAFMLKGRLQRHGFEVTIAVDGQEGVDKAQHDRPDHCCQHHNSERREYADLRSDEDEDRGSFALPAPR